MEIQIWLYNIFKYLYYIYIYIQCYIELYYIMLCFDSSDTFTEAGVTVGLIYCTGVPIKLVPVFSLYAQEFNLNIRVTDSQNALILLM